MPQFELIGHTDPLLHIRMAHKEVLFAESDAMVMMDTTLDLVGNMRGGPISGILRSGAKNESFFLQKFVAERGEGEALIAPTNPGGIHLLDIGPAQYCMNDGTFLAMTDNVKINTSMQRLTNAMFGQTGGLLVGKTSGHGKLAVSGHGSVHEVSISAGTPAIIDNGHVVAWDASLKYEIALSTSKGQGFLSNMFSTATTGEGIVLQFQGSGKVIICSRNITTWRKQFGDKK